MIEPDYEEASAVNGVNLRAEYRVYTRDRVLLYSDSRQYKSTKPREGLFNLNQSKIYMPYVYNFKQKAVDVEIQLQNSSELTGKLRGLTIYVQTNNEAFFYYFWYFKWLLFVLSVMTMLKFNRSYYAQLRQTRTLEQSHIAVLGVLLAAYNFPVSFYINETHPTIIFMLLTSCVNIVFYSYLLYLWLTTFEVD